MSDATQKPHTVPPAATKLNVQLPVHFIKSTCFRVVHANGVWYGGDNQGNLHLTFFNERNAIPKLVVVNLDERGAVVSEDETKRESKKGMVREMEVDIVMSIQAAADLYQTLGENLKAIQETQSQSMPEKVKAFRDNLKLT
jgi:hypothetical protein